MAQPPDVAPDRPRLLLIEARYYDDVGSALLDGAQSALDAAGAAAQCVTVPGALEIPFALQAAIAAGRFASEAAPADRFDGVVALGCVIRGETSHYDYVCDQSIHWLNAIAIEHSIPVGNAILTTENREQALIRARGKRPSLDAAMHPGKGADAVRACLSVINLAREFKGMTA
ncbi:MAG: 6,7-dimethyl-8-ribityllumazine synthase [Pseudomonadota bacterium]